ncbi:dolichol monophosphate mannose synthase [Pigmentiphaga litoralis]|uniref:glycosyltransferase n=1 Tax=Pigmentiphaga litoralis TaxID=516702 RepID=UPI0016767263|nr:glycosyltransferase family 2 protein [Pigmentiphaga litoralis]GGX19301.1 dolichol monophosphate mannose synthase [Pigmentiphaga litoralis]
MFREEQLLQTAAEWPAFHSIKTAPGPELAVIVPVFNERDNVQEIVRRLKATLVDYSWEVIFVDDDSPDGTADLVRQLGNLDQRVRCVQRIGRRGLSSACVEGMLASTAKYFAVMDGDLQHDENLLPEMLDNLLCTDIDVVIGSRYGADGDIGDWDERRARMSRVATWITRTALNTKLSDPMSGFFMIRREAFLERARSMSGIGFKILLDLFASGPQPLRYMELSYEFRSRSLGESKMDSRAVWDFLMLVLDKRLGGIIPVRFLNFALVGVLGVGVHLGIMFMLFEVGKSPFIWSQSVAMLVAMTSNFALNNILTYRDMRLRGWHWVRGWGSFVLACSIGGLANVGIASYLFDASTTWIAATLAGTVAGALWNYALTSTYTWRRKAQ